MTTYTANGTFDVTTTPQTDAQLAEVSLARLMLDKKFSGDLQATGKGQMLACGTPTQGSAGYVAIEHVSGTLHGREGSFVFQHTGTMNRGEQQLSITVVPDSGTGALQGIEGTFTLIVNDGQHFYSFEYSLTSQ
ncbi:DUF3224 domain-containing protein [soil metagenome]